MINIWRECSCAKRREGATVFNMPAAIRSEDYRPFQAYFAAKRSLAAKSPGI
jgi:hypothetical protein